MSKDLSKRASTQPSNHLHTSNSPQTHRGNLPSRIVGVSKKGFFVLFLALSLSFNYLLFSKLERLEGSVASLERLTKVAQVAPVNSGSRRAPASAGESHLNFRSSTSAFDKLDQIDINDYSIQNYKEYSNYRYLLSDLSRNSRYFDTRISEIRDHYVKNHRITSTHRNEYNRLLDKIAQMKNSLADKHDFIKENWKKGGGSGFASSY